MRFWPALALDVICVLVFAIVGRRSHAEAGDLVGVFRTAWPFLAGAAVGVLVGRTWRHPASYRAAVGVWLAAVALGMALRVLSGGTTQLSFIVVTTVVLAVLIFGWRAAYRLIQHARAATPAKAPTS